MKTQPRARPNNVKEQIVRQREFKNIRLAGEEVAEFDYRPAACRKTYRMVVVQEVPGRQPRASRSCSTTTATSST